MSHTKLMFCQCSSNVPKYPIFGQPSTWEPKHLHMPDVNFVVVFTEQASEVPGSNVLPEWHWVAYYVYVLSVRPV